MESRSGLVRGHDGADVPACRHVTLAMGRRRPAAGVECGLHRGAGPGVFPRNPPPADSWRIPRLIFSPRDVGLAALKSGSAADFVLLVVQGEPFLSSLIVAIITGTGLGFLVVWMVTRHTRRMAEHNAVQLLAVARREAAVGAQELKTKVAEELQAKRAEVNRDFDRREIEL